MLSGAGANGDEITSRVRQELGGGATGEGASEQSQDGRGTRAGEKR